MLIVVSKHTHEEHLFQTLRTSNKQFKIDTAFSTGNNGIFVVTISNEKPCFAKSFSDKDGFIQITIPPGD